jgi:hypothetical protein
MDTKKAEKEKTPDAVPVQGENWLQDLLQHMAAQENKGAKSPQGSAEPVSRKTVERLIDKVTSRS